MISDELFAVCRRSVEKIDRAANPPIAQSDQNRGRRFLLSGGGAAVSARKLAASLWRLSETTKSGGSVRWRRGSSDRIGFQCTTEGATKWDHQCNSKPRSVVENLEGERDRRKRFDVANSKLVREISEAKSSAQKLMHTLEKEKKDREISEGMCKELAEKIEGYKAEIRELKSERDKVREEVENERKMTQLAGVWREEQARMKMCDAKLILENKFAEMNALMGELKALLSETKLQKGESVSNIKSTTIVVSSTEKGFPTGGVKARRNPHVVRAMEGHVEWPRGIKGSYGPTAEKILEAKLKSQKTITPNLLKRRGTS